jgi:hypothetical protein
MNQHFPHSRLCCELKFGAKMVLMMSKYQIVVDVVEDEYLKEDQITILVWGATNGFAILQVLLIESIVRNLIL